MNILRFAEHLALPPEKLSVVELAYKNAISILKVSETDQQAREMLAKTVINLAKTGESDCDRLAQAAARSFTAVRRANPTTGL